MSEATTPGKCHTFICYRQSDGLEVAEWLFQRLHGRLITLDRSGNTLELDVYFDQDAPAIDDWREFWGPKLEVCRALVFVCTRQTATRRDGKDWLFSELDYWLEKKTTAPIVIDAIGDGGHYVPAVLTERWPNAQRIVCTPQVWPDGDTRERMEKRAIERVLDGIKISEEGVYFEELEHLRRLNRDLQLETARAKQNEERATDARVNLQVNNGARAIDDGDLWGSVVWFAEALTVDTERHAAEDEHRVRLRAVARRLPTLEQIWFVESRLWELRFLPDGVRLLAVGKSLEIYDSKQSTPLRLGDSNGQVVILRFDPADDTVLALSYLYREQTTIYEVARWNLGTGTKTTLHTFVEKVFDVSLAGTLVVESADGLRAQQIGGGPLWDGPWAAPDDAWKLAMLSADGRWLVAATEHEVWARSLAAIASPIQLGRFDQVDRIAVDAGNGRYAAACGRTVQIWHENEGTWHITSFDVGQVVASIAEIVDIDFSPDGKHIVVTSKRKDDNLTSLILLTVDSKPVTLAGRVDHEQAVERWEHRPPSTRSGGAGVASFAAGKFWNPFEKVARFSPDGRLLATISNVDDHVRVWDWRVARPLTPPLQHFRSSITTFAFGNDGATIASSAKDNTIRLWSFARPIGDALAAGSRDRVDHLVFSPDGSRVGVAGSQPTPEIWKPHAEGRELTLEGHHSAITTLRFSPSGTLVATGSFDKVVHVHNAQTGRHICNLTHTSTIDDVLFHSESRLLAWSSGSRTPGEIRAWELPSARLLGTLPTLSRATMAAWNPNGTRVAVVLERRSEYGIPEDELQSTSRPLVWDVERDILMVLPALARQPEWVAFNEDGSELWLYGDGQIEEFSAGDGSKLRAYPIDSPFPNLLAVSEDGAKIATGKWGRQAQVIDRRTGRPLTPQMDHQLRGSVASARFSADGHRLLTVSEEQVRVWSTTTGHLLAPPFFHDVRVNDAVLDASGSRVVISTYPVRDGSAGKPSTIQFWSLAPDSRPLHALRLEVEVASARHIDGVGGMVPLSHDQYRSRWEALSASRRTPATHAADVDLWHQQQAASGDEFGRRFHADQLAQRVGHHVSSDSSHLVSRAGVLAELGRIDAALADLTAAIDLAPGDRIIRSRRGQLYAERGDLALALADLSEASEVHSTTVCHAVRANDVEAVCAVAYLATVLQNAETYRAAARRTLRLLTDQDASSSPEECWNAIFFAVRVCTLAPNAGLADADWSVLKEALRRRRKPAPTKEDVALLAAQIALRRGDAAATQRALSGVEFPPWDQLVLALSNAMHGRHSKASELWERAQEGIRLVNEQQQSPGRDSRPYAPGWPTDLQIADLLANELKALLQRPS